MRDLLIKKEIPNSKKNMSSSTIINIKLANHRENKDPNQTKKQAETKNNNQTRNPFLSLDQKNIHQPTHLPYHAYEIF